LTSLTHTFRIPVLLIVTWRGQPGGPADEPQHELMGAITPGMLEQMQIPWALFPSESGVIGPALDLALAHFAKEGRPFALVMQKNSVAESARAYGPAAATPGALAPVARPQANHTRRDVLAAIQAATGERDILIATTGYTGRELFALGDRANQLYMVGSMGCAISLALGLAIARPAHRVIAIDGDGAALMRLGAMTTAGFEKPPNLLHLLLDNGLHESTGGQATVSPGVDFCALAAAAGYPSVAATADPAALGAMIAKRDAGLAFVHVPILPGISAGLPRPTMTPAAVAARLRTALMA
jgi:phosphonopyruvate decarboxylase